MTVERSGAETEADAVWVPALARGLIRHDALRSMRYCDGYTDLLGRSAPAGRSLAQRAMNSPAVAAIYQHLWRPIMVAALSLHGISIDAERERASAALCLKGQQRVLDVACGPGNFTGFFAKQLAGDGFVVGLDNSVPMMERAARDNACSRAVYMRGDALDLPFNDHAFDAVSCFAALHLMPEPLAVLHEMVRVLSPGGRIAVMTTYGRESFLLRKGLELGATICGVRVFDRSTVPTFFTAAGLIDIEQDLRGISQFVVARRPRDATGRRRAR
ncbi:SAM-dependent methyltransferase [Mycobacterium sp. OAS707]|uniref:class I SAM-dependent methyltransferase n=1 Tax=unclassified Mycobacterium TaxID=2642494 RepID=UPI00178B23AE|nr:class I SAM-dependent methyltransferase [Mycobacterium sp. OAS707]MBE1548518.1 SAM-dependent methyltransferase [Mycobacterium sp. OAS707]